ncbi:MAG: NADH-quinone oxidoreductase subunit L [Verrucomicrobiales bacterium]|nr:NADH-quinone oxidoreductase subunit L [Verrucomicrobiales bacterium]
MDVNTIAWLILLLPLASAAVILLGTKKSAGISALISTGSVIATLVLSFLLLAQPDTAAAKPLQWLSLGDFEVTIGLKLDSLAQGMMIIVTGIGTLVHVFSLGYMHDDAGKARFFAGLSQFMFSMTGIVLADNFAMMFIFWELVGVSSYILIGHWYDKDSAADAAKKAFLVNRIGDFGFMIGILLVWVLTGSIYFDEIAKAIGGVQNANLLNAAVLLVFCGAVGKSAQLPLHVWLPDAMEGPTPVSALIHAATMVAAGVYMLARVSFLVGAAEMAADTIAIIGGATALLAALMATQQNDIKRVLAYSTLSQLGYMIMAQGLHDGSDAGMFHLYTHAWFKALLFLGSGAVIFACHHEQDIWKMGGLRQKMPITFWTFLIGTAALIAVPGTSGFWSKEAILEAAWHDHNYLVWGLGIAVAFLTPFYMTRLFVVAFLGKPRTKDADHAHEVSPIMWVPLAILAVMAVISAYITGPLEAKGHVAFHMSLTAILSLAGLVVGVLAGWKLYAGCDRDPVNIKLFANKFYLDELYLGIVRLFQDFVGMTFDAVDRYLIEPITVRLPALAAMSSGYVLRLLQVGNLQAYGFLFGLGAVVLIWLIVF